ncbi:MAG: tyrosine-type recombinase/integrase [Rickettsiales bacterium]|nr:tyrosine-type recombinase/integrase [Rickettsiales bacterium]
MPKLNKTIVERESPSDKDILIHDNELRGFRCKVTPKGKRVYQLYYRNAQKQQRNPTIGVHGNITCDQARSIARQWLAQIANGGDPSADKQLRKKLITIEQFIEIYLERYSSQLKARSLIEEKKLIEKHIKPKLGKLSINTVDRNTFIQVHQRMKETPYAANRVIELTGKLLRLAQRWQYRTEIENPCSFVDKYKEEPRDRFLKNEELLRLSEVLNQCEIEQTEMPKAILAIRLLLFTGCRKNEICQLEWQWIDFEESRINLPDSKTGKKTIYLAPPALELLASAECIEGCPYVLPGIGKKGYYVTLQKAWDRIRRKAGLEDVRLHDLRHSYASMAAAGGMNLYMIGKLLGHTQQSTTERYAHLVGKPMHEAAHLVGNTMAAVMAGNKAKIIPING